MANEPITFAQFGEGFMLWAFTPQVIGTSVDAALRKMGTMRIHEKEGVAEVNAQVSSRGCSVKRVSPAELAISIPLAMDMDIRIAGIVPEKYAVAVSVEVRFLVEAYRPLWVFLNMRPIPLGAVAVSVQGKSWTQIAQGIGHLGDKVRETVAQKVWESFNAPEVLKSRKIDVLESIQDAQRKMGSLSDGLRIVAMNAAASPSLLGEDFALCAAYDEVAPATAAE